MTETHFDAGAALAALADRIEGERDAFARVYFRERLAPFCERYGLRFAYGNGGYILETSAGALVGGLTGQRFAEGCAFLAALETIDAELCDEIGGAAAGLCAYMPDVDARRPCVGVARAAVSGLVEPIERATAAAQRVAPIAEHGAPDSATHPKTARGYAAHAAIAAERAAAEGAAAAEAFEAARAAVRRMREGRESGTLPGAVCADAARVRALRAIDETTNHAHACRANATRAQDCARDAERLGESTTAREDRRRRDIVRESMRAMDRAAE